MNGRFKLNGSQPDGRAIRENNASLNWVDRNAISPVLQYERENQVPAREQNQATQTHVKSAA